MYLPQLLVTGVILVSLLIAAGLLSSRSITEQMVRRGILPHIFLDLIPVFMVGARLLALSMILIGAGRLLAVSGLLSWDWMERYGLASLLVVLGVSLLVITFRRPRRP